MDLGILLNGLKGTNSIPGVGSREQGGGPHNLVGGARLGFYHPPIFDTYFAKTVLKISQLQ